MNALAPPAPYFEDARNESCATLAADLANPLISENDAYRTHLERMEQITRSEGVVTFHEPNFERQPMPLDYSASHHDNGRPRWGV